MEPDARAACCGKRPEKTRGAAFQDIPGLAPLLKSPGPDEPGTGILRRECTACGQIWEQHSLPMMHADVDVVVKQGVVADLEDPRPQAPPTPPPPVDRLLRADRWIFLGCTLTGLVIGFATRPPGRNDHAAFCLLGGVLTGIVINILRYARKR